MGVVELVIIASAILFEAFYVITKDQNALSNFLDKIHPLLRMTVAIASNAYMLMVIIWCFNSDIIIRMAGLILLALSIIAMTLRIKNRGIIPNLYLILDTSTSLAVLILVAYYRIVVGG